MATFLLQVLRFAESRKCSLDSASPESTQPRLGTRGFLPPESNLAAAAAAADGAVAVATSPASAAAASVSCSEAGGCSSPPAQDRDAGRQRSAADLFTTDQLVSEAINVLYVAQDDGLVQSIPTKQMAMMVGQDEESGMGEDDAADRVGGGEHEDMFPLQPPDQELGRQGTFSCLTEEHCSSTRLFLRRHGHQ